MQDEQLLLTRLLSRYGERYFYPEDATPDPLLRRWLEVEDQTDGDASPPIPQRFRLSELGEAYAGLLSLKLWEGLSPSQHHLLNQIEQAAVYLAPVPHEAEQHLLDVAQYACVTSGLLAMAPGQLEHRAAQAALQAGAILLANLRSPFRGLHVVEQDSERRAVWASFSMPLLALAARAILRAVADHSHHPAQTQQLFDAHDPAWALFGRQVEMGAEWYVRVPYPLDQFFERVSDWITTRWIYERTKNAHPAHLVYQAPQDILDAPVYRGHLWAPTSWLKADFISSKFVEFCSGLEADL